MGGKSSSLELLTVILGNAIGGSFSADDEEAFAGLDDKLFAFSGGFSAPTTPEKNKLTISPAKSENRGKVISNGREGLIESMSTKDTFATVKLHADTQRG